MIILDTNVVSEFMRPSPQPEVLGWLDDQPTSTALHYSECIRPAGRSASNCS